MKYTKDLLRRWSRVLSLYVMEISPKMPGSFQRRETGLSALPLRYSESKDRLSPPYQHGRPHNGGSQDHKVGEQTERHSNSMRHSWYSHGGSVDRNYNISYKSPWDESKFFCHVKDGWLDRSINE